MTLSNEGDDKDETMNTTTDRKDKKNSKQENNGKQPQELKSGTSLKSDISSPDQEAKPGAKDSKDGAVMEKFTTESEDTERKATWETNKSNIEILRMTGEVKPQRLKQTNKYFFCYKQLNTFYHPYYIHKCLDSEPLTFLLVNWYIMFNKFEKNIQLHMIMIYIGALPCQGPRPDINNTRGGDSNSAHILAPTFLQIQLK